MKKLVIFASLALAMGITIPSWACTDYGDVLPENIDPLTAADDLPCVSASTVRPEAGAIVFYKEGMLGFIDSRGNITLGGGRDTGRLDAFAADSDISRGEQIGILMQMQDVSDRALDYSREVIP
jgi:hypothetical protein